MSDVQEQRTHLRWVGGEAGHRSFFGGTHSKTRITGIAIFIVGGMLGMILGGGLPLLAVALVGIGLTMLVTQRTHNGTIQERRRKRSRWAARKRLGTNVFVPYNVAGWDQIQSAASSADKAERRAAEITARQMRANPDGSDGMGWLQYGSNMPGIAWHAPLGEQPYLSVAFSVSGQLRGMETAGALNRAATSWGKFLAHRAAPVSLIRDVQTLTRVLPPDTAKHDIWYNSSARPGPLGPTTRRWRSGTRSSSPTRKCVDARPRTRWCNDTSSCCRGRCRRCSSSRPRSTGAGATVGVRSWPSRSRRPCTASGEARMGQVNYLTARQTAAVIMHQQNPSIPIDLRSAKHITPLSVGIASHDEYSAHVVDGGYDPTVLADGDPIESAPAVTWWHRTAAIHGEDLASAGRSPLWTLDLMIGRELGFIRSVSFHMHLVPAAQAKAAARQDVVRDAAGVYAQKQKGVIVSDEAEGLLGAAERRRRDLAAGSHHHGVSWIGYVTITAPTREDLAQASRRLESVCDTGLGVDRLDWQDSFQAGASGTTWPIGRGLRPDNTTAATRLMNTLAGRGTRRRCHDRHQEPRPARQRAAAKAPWYANVPGLKMFVPPELRQEFVTGEDGEAVDAQRRPVDVPPFNLPGGQLRTSVGAATRGWYSPRLTGSPSTTKQAEILNSAVIGNPTGDEGIVNGRDNLSQSMISYDAPTAYNAEPRQISSPNVIVLGTVGYGKSSLTKTVGVARPWGWRTGERSCSTRRTRAGRASTRPWPTTSARSRCGSTRPAVASA